MGHAFASPIAAYGISNFSYSDLKIVKVSFLLSHQNARYYFMRYAFRINSVRGLGGSFAECSKI